MSIHDDLVSFEALMDAQAAAAGVERRKPTQADIDAARAADAAAVRIAKAPKRRVDSLRAMAKSGDTNLRSGAVRRAKIEGVEL